MDKVILELRQSSFTKFFAYILLIFGIAFLTFVIWKDPTMSNIKLEELRNNIFSDKFIATVITYIVIIPLIIGYSILVITASRVLKVKGSKLLITSKWKMYNKILNLDDIVSWGFLSGTNNGSMISIKTKR